MNSFLGFNFSFSKQFPAVAAGGKDFQLSLDGLNPEGQKLGTLKLRLKTKQGKDLAFVAAAKWTSQKDLPADQRIASFLPPKSETGYYESLEQFESLQGESGEMFVRGFLYGLGTLTSEQAKASAKLFTKLLSYVDFKTGSIRTSKKLKADMLSQLFDNSWISVSFNSSLSVIKNRLELFTNSLAGDKVRFSFDEESAKDYATGEEE